MLGKTEGKRTTEDEVVGWHHRLNGHEFVQTLGDGEGQGSLGKLHKIVSLSILLNNVFFIRILRTSLTIESLSIYPFIDKC